ncbi:MAG: nuclease, partial [Zetaproteobacteria bacterium]
SLVAPHDVRWGIVARVIDGDTFVLRSGEKVRLLGIDAPELAHGTTPEEPLARKARARLRRLVEGRRVRLAFDAVRTDGYGRLLAQVYLADGRWVNGILVREGLALVYTFEPNHRWVGKLLALERAARRERRGIWRTRRFAVRRAERVHSRDVGRFVLVRGRISDARRWFWRMGRLAVSVPRKARAWFGRPPLVHTGDEVLVRGVLRASPGGKLYIAIHSPWDLEVIGR